MTILRTALTSAGLLVLLVQSPAASADPSSPLDRQFEASLGVFFLKTDTNIRVDGTGALEGTPIDLERQFGLQDTDRFRIDGYWRFKPRHKVRFMYFSSSGSAERRIQDEIEFGGETFPVNALVRADMDIEIYELAYEYAFLRRENYEVAGTIGLHNLGLKAGLSVEGESAGVETSAEADGNGPLPVIGLRGLWVLSDQFYLDAQAQFFALEFDNYDGNLQDYRIGLNWQPWQHFGMGVGYNYFRTSLDVTKTHFIGTLNFRYDGPQVFFTASF